MRYGIFSDVHSNTEALDAVLALFKKEGVERYLCVGDIVGYGAEPGECIRTIRDLPCEGIVGGNHDWASVGLLSLEWFNPVAREAVLWTQKVLQPEESQFLQCLRSASLLGDITLVHGSLDSPEEFRYIYDVESATETLRRLQTKICFVGHSHLPMILSIDVEGKIDSYGTPRVALKKECRYLVNVGSVGQPRDGDPRAVCVIFDSESSCVEIQRTPYDIPSTQKKILKAGLPSVLASRLSEGW